VSNSVTIILERRELAFFDLRHLLPSERAVAAATAIYARTYPVAR
jgi:hypothetical protein